MRTIRNTTFIVLCAMVYLTPAPVQASSSCWADPTGWQGGCEMFVGSCGNCEGDDAWGFASDTCGWPNGEVVEFFCEDDYLRFGCCYFVLD